MSKRHPLRTILLVFALITSPLICCGATQLLSAIPSSLLPSSIDFTLNLFEAEAQVENHTSETLYVTAISTTYGYPMVISQNIAFRQRDIPIQPNESAFLTYDSADQPLAGIAVCQTAVDCRLLAVDYSGAYQITSYEALPALDPGWLAAIQSRSLYNFLSVIVPILSLVPILLFFGWWYTGRLEKKQVS